MGRSGVAGTLRLPGGTASSLYSRRASGVRAEWYVGVGVECIRFVFVGEFRSFCSFVLLEFVRLFLFIISSSFSFFVFHVSFSARIWVRSLG